MIQYSPTTGHNIVERFKKNAARPLAEQKEVRYLTQGKGLDRRGEPQRNEFIIVSLDEVRSSSRFTAARVQLAGSATTVDLLIFHNTRYLVPVEQRKVAAK